MIKKYENGIILEKINDTTAKVFIPLKIIVKNGMPNFLKLLKEDMNFKGKYFTQYDSNMNKDGFTAYFHNNIIPYSEFSKKG